jgi:hypothetical protein
MRGDTQTKMDIQSYRQQNNFISLIILKNEGGHTDKDRYTLIQTAR